MSREKKYLEPVEKLHKSNYMDIALFNFILGITSIRPEFTITKAIELFGDTYKLGDDYNPECELTTYYRMLDKFRDSLKTDIK
jgi:hypothetical protein